MLRIHLSDLYKDLRQHTRGIKESFPRSSGDPTSRIRISTAEQILSHDENVEISLNGGRRQDPMDGSEAISLRCRAMEFNNDSQSLPAHLQSSSARRVIMRPGDKTGLLEQNYLWQRRASNRVCSRSICQIFMRISGNTLEVPRKVSPEAQEILRHRSGARLMNRFCHMLKLTNFMIRGR